MLAANDALAALDAVEALLAAQQPVIDAAVGWHAQSDDAWLEDLHDAVTTLVAAAPPEATEETQG